MSIPDYCTAEIRKAFSEAYAKCDEDPDDRLHPVTRGLDAVLKLLRDQQPVIPPSKEFQNVKDFHKKFDLLNFDTPGHLSSGKLRERIEFLREELNEFIEAAGFEHGGDGDLSYTGIQDLAKQADALVDLVYVACGTAVMLGLPWDWLWDDVQRANMAKVRGVTHRGHAVDVKKPEGWQGPQGERILELAGYRHEDWLGCGTPGSKTWNLIEENCRDDTQRDK